MRYCIAVTIVCCLLVTGLYTASMSEPAHPTYTAVLCQGIDDQDKPLGRTKTFQADNQAVWLVLNMSTALPAGHRLTAKVYADDQSLVLAGAPSPTNGKRTSYVFGFHLAGRQWASRGGTFTFTVSLDDAAVPLASEPFTITRHQRWALLIGIKDYAPRGPENDLAGCDIDIKRMENLLRFTFGFDPAHIVTLADLQATKAGIESAFTDLARRAGPNDAVVIYYSGHGAQVPDLNGDEEDGYDEALVPADVVGDVLSTEADINRLLLDDRIAELLAAFKTKNITMIVDACHSGTVTAVGDTQPPKELRQSRFRHFAYSRQLEQQSERTPFRPQPATTAGLDHGGVGVLLSSSRAWELSYSDATIGGFFTVVLAEVLQHADGLCWDDIMRQVQQRLYNYNFHLQSPNATGATTRLPFTTTEVAPTLAYVRPSVAVNGAISKTAKGIPPRELSGSAQTHRMLLAAQKSFNLEQVGALYDIYPKHDVTFSGKPTGQARITGDTVEVGMTRDKNGAFLETQHMAVADILQGRLQEGDRLVARAVPFPVATPSVAVVVSAQLTAEERKPVTDLAVTLKALLARERGIILKEFTGSNPVEYYVQPRMQGKELTSYIWARGGQYIANFTGTADAQARKVCSTLAVRHAQHTRWTRLANPSPAFRLRLDVAQAAHIVRPEDTLAIRVESDQPCHFAIFTSVEGTVPTLLAVSPTRATRYATTIVAPKINGMLAIKVLALDQQADTLVTAARQPADTRVQHIYAAMRALYPGEGGPTFLSTTGWATAMQWVTVAP